MSWLAIRWDDSGSVFDDLDRILEGSAYAASHADSDEQESPSYAWLNHPTLPHAKVWSPVPLLPTGPSSRLEERAESA